jgi:RecB family endonuclease NucS
MLMAFLQRVINGGGRIEREYGLGRGALDLIIEWKNDRHVIEVKLRRDTETEEDALEQVSGYLDHLGMTEGWMVVFDLRKGLTWQEKLYQRNVDAQGKLIRIVGC